MKNISIILQIVVVNAVMMTMVLAEPYHSRINGNSVELQNEKVAVKAENQQQNNNDDSSSSYGMSETPNDDEGA